VLLFTAMTSLSTVLLFGLAPAFRAVRLKVGPVLRSQRGSIGTGEERGRFPLGKALIAGQVTLSLVLLVGAALLSSSLRKLERIDPGFDRDHLLVVDVDAVARGYSGDRQLALLRELNARFSAVPGVAAVSFSENGLFSGCWKAVISPNAMWRAALRSS
jgi:hypothetical protein